MNVLTGKTPYWSLLLLLLAVVSIGNGMAYPLACSANEDSAHSAFVVDVDSGPPASVRGTPAAGQRVPVTPPEYEGTEVHHMLFLPSEWRKESNGWPVMVEYTGNRFAKSGSSGRVEDAALGYGICDGKFIWLTLPFVSNDGRSNALNWWGDEVATVEYAKKNVRRVCEEYGGDVNQVFLCGFSRGAIAVNYIGLHDDEISQLWCGFITHDHYDGEREWRGTSWGSPLKKYREGAAQRLQRVGDRPYLVCQAGGTAAIQEFLRTSVSLKNFTFVDVDPKQILGGFPNRHAVHPHTDRWMRVDSPARRQVRRWLWDSSDSHPGPEQE